MTHSDITRRGSCCSLLTLALASWYQDELLYVNSSSGDVGERWGEVGAAEEENGLARGEALSHSRRQIGNDLQAQIGLCRKGRWKPFC